MKRYDLLLDGKKVRVWAQKIAGVLWYHYNGETRTFQPKSQYASGGSGASSITPGEVTSPMPGKIMKLHVSLGDIVSKGDVVVLMEAMKMEYSLEADISGKIEEVSISTGDQVSLGQVLIKIKAEEDNG